MAKKEKTVKPETNKKAKKEEKNKRHFWKDFKAELKKVVWPTPKQLLNSTVAVVVIVLVVGIIVFTLDFVFEQINSKGINALQTTLQNKYSNTVATEDTASVEDTDDASSESVETVTQELELEEPEE